MRSGAKLMLKRLVLALCCAIALASCGGEETPTPVTAQPTVELAGDAKPAPIKRYRAKIINTFPHDPAAFTQGLFFHDGFVYEGTGRRGQSVLRKVELETGRVVQQQALDNKFFGEGIALWQDQIIGLTWQSGIGLVHSLDDFEKRETFFYSGEGWGLTASPTHLIMSDGSASLRILEPESFAERTRLTVTANGTPVTKLNELEWIDGLIYANIWQTELLVQIDPSTGNVIGVADLSGLLAQEDMHSEIDVLNGIAYDPATKRLFVTGKNWPKLFEIELVKIDG